MQAERANKALLKIRQSRSLERFKVVDTGTKDSVIKADAIIKSLERIATYDGSIKEVMNAPALPELDSFRNAGQKFTLAPIASVGKVANLTNQDTHVSERHSRLEELKRLEVLRLQSEEKEERSAVTENMRQSIIRNLHKSKSMSNNLSIAEKSEEVPTQKFHEAHSRYLDHVRLDLGGKLESIAPTPAQGSLDTLASLRDVQGTTYDLQKMDSAKVSKAVNSRVSLLEKRSASYKYKIGLP